MSLLTKVIIEKIAQEGDKIPFSTFMQLALYTPNLGYYTSDKIKFGPQGDFTTAPEISPLFAKTIAHALAPLIKDGHFDTILEFGAGSGKLAADLLIELEAQSALPSRYDILEVSGHLKALQRQTIKEKATHLSSKVHHLSTLPDNASNTLIIGNEVLDAMPVARFRIHHGKLEELYITTQGEQLAECFDQPSIELEQALEPLLPLPEGYQSEINLFAKPWLTALEKSFDNSLVLLFDYGFSTDEYYHPDRANGTLMCHYQHKAHSDALCHIGEQDITAHVDFGYLAYEAQKLGMSLIGYTTLAGFVIDNQILSMAENTSAAEQFDTTQAIKQFTMPQEMGELFKAIAFGIDYSGALSGFSLRDLRRML